MHASFKWKLVRVAVTTCSLFTGWLLFTATLDPTSLIMGAVLSLVVALLTFDLFVLDGEAGRRSLLPRLDLLAVFMLVVIGKMYIASFRVMFSVVRGTINPRVVHFRTRLRSDLARVLLTNAITLTPGTITLHLDDDHLLVHWLNANTTHSKYAALQIKGGLERLLKRVWV